MDQQARRLADSVWLVFAARIVSVFGVPLAAWLAARPEAATSEPGPPRAAYGEAAHGDHDACPNG